jgi:hypothetical protein
VSHTPPPPPDKPGGNKGVCGEYGRVGSREWMGSQVVSCNSKRSYAYIAQIVLQQDPSCS